MTFFNLIVIVVELGMDIHSCRSFMIAALRSQMKSLDYVYIIPWLAHVCSVSEKA